MPKIYERATPEDLALLSYVMQLYHPALHAAGLHVALTIARKFDANEEPVRCVKFAGAHAAALTRIVPARRRIYDNHDVEVELDGVTWDGLNVHRKHALLDHELTHVVVIEVDGEIQQDDRGRPKVKLVPDDIILTAFVSVIRRHGTEALEWGSITKAHEAATDAYSLWQEAQPAPGTPPALQVQMNAVLHRVAGQMGIDIPMPEDTSGVTVDPLAVTEAESYEQDRHVAEARPTVAEAHAASRPSLASRLRRPRPPLAISSSPSPETQAQRPTRRRERDLAEAQAP
jgi:hypothetical protein